MTVIKRMLCLANSRKYGGRCVAGLEWVDGRPAGWLRPVSHRDTGELMDVERRFAGGIDPTPGDLMEMTLMRAVPHAYYQEDWMTDGSYRWRRTGRMGYEAMAALAEAGPLWLAGSGQAGGANDRIPLAEAEGLGSSLRLVHPEQVALEEEARPEWPVPRIRVRFVLAGAEYCLRVTDPAHETPPVDHEARRDECLLTISLGEPYQGFTYRLAAAVIRPRVLSVGHSNQGADEFITRLERLGVSTVFDVRSAPGSRFAGQFNRGTLEPALTLRGIAYEFLGEELGARPEDPACYEGGRVRFARLRARPAFRRGIERVALAARRGLPAVMCAEKEPMDCHRTAVVGRALAAQGVQVDHLLATGRLEPQDSVLGRIVRLSSAADGDLFAEPPGRHGLLEAALAEVEERIAFTREEGL